MAVAFSPSEGRTEAVVCGWLDRRNNAQSLGKCGRELVVLTRLFGVDLKG